MSAAATVVRAFYPPGLQKAMCKPALANVSPAIIGERPYSPITNPEFTLRPHGKRFQHDNVAGSDSEGFSDASSGGSLSPESGSPLARAHQRRLLHVTTSPTASSSGSPRTLTRVDSNSSLASIREDARHQVDTSSPRRVSPHRGSPRGGGRFSFGRRPKAGTKRSPLSKLGVAPPPPPSQHALLGPAPLLSPKLSPNNHRKAYDFSSPTATPAPMEAPVFNFAGSRKASKKSLQPAADKDATNSGGTPSPKRYLQRGMDVLVVLLLMCLWSCTHNLPGLRIRCTVSCHRHSLNRQTRAAPCIPLTGKRPL